MDALYIEASIFFFFNESRQRRPHVFQLRKFVGTGVWWNRNGQQSEGAQLIAIHIQIHVQIWRQGTFIRVAVFNRSSPIAAPFEKNISTVIERKNGCLS